MKTVKWVPVLAAILLWVCASAQPGPAQSNAGPLGKTAKAAKAGEGEKGAAASPAGKKSGAKRAPAPKTPVGANPTGPRGASWRAPDFYVEFIHEPSGRVLLRIHYPWKVHARPSVEIRQLSDDESDTGEIRPMGFTSRIMKGDVATAVFQCRDRSAETPVVRKLKHEGQEFEVVGARNRLGSGSVCAVFPPKPDAKNPVTCAVYPLLANWAIDQNTLVLELPEPYFAERGWIRVWFLREGDILWWKTVFWPGRTGIAGSGQ